LVKLYKLPRGQTVTLRTFSMEQSPSIDYDICSTIRETPLLVLETKCSLFISFWFWTTTVQQTYHISVTSNLIIISIYLSTLQVWNKNLFWFFFFVKLATLVAQLIIPNLIKPVICGKDINYVTIHYIMVATELLPTLLYNCTVV
jgi:hypothetical protein